MIAKSLKKLVRDRAQGCCEYCLSLEDFCPEPFAIEHIVPQSKGGETVEDNSVKIKSKELSQFTHGLL